MLYSLVIRSQLFIEPVLLDCEIHKCFSVFFSFFGWDRMA